MYNASTLKTQLIGLVGWRQNDDPSGVQISDVTASSSGLYFNDEDPLLTFDNLFAVAPEYARLGQDATAQGASFSAWLKRKTEAAIVRTIQDWINLKAYRRSVASLMERTELFTTAGSFENQDTNHGDLVGREFRPITSLGIVYAIDAIALQLTEAQTLTLYLFHSSQKEPITSYEAEYTTPYAVQWFTDLPSSWAFDGTGNWYVGYLQEDLVGASINCIYDYGHLDGGLSNMANNRYFSSAAFRAPDQAAAELSNLPGYHYTQDTSYGLNFRITAKCDYTDFIASQASLFQTAISKRVAIDMLMELVRNANARTSRLETNINKEDILFEIHGNPEGRSSGLLAEYHAALKAITLDDEALDPICLPRAKGGVRFKMR